MTVSYKVLRNYDEIGFSPDKRHKRALQAGAQTVIVRHDFSPLQPIW